VNPVTTLSAIAGYNRDQELEGGVYDRETTSFGFGVARDLDAAQNLSFDITGDLIDTTDEDGFESVEGYSVAFAYDRDLPTGSLGLAVSSRLQSNGRQNTIFGERNIDLPDGELVFGLGVANNDSSDLNPIFRLDYTRELATGVISARAEQSESQAIDSNDQFLNRVAAVDYSQEINSVSGWSTSLFYADSDNLTDGTNTERWNFGIEYRRAITADWDLVSGYTYEESTDSDSTVEANTVFLTIERDFVTRP
jgi:hypothetical protein